MPRQNYCCENTDSCSLISVTSLKTCSESTKSSCNHTSSCNHISSTCPDSSSICPGSSSICPGSSSICPGSSSICPESSSCVESSSCTESSCMTYSDKTSTSSECSERSEKHIKLDTNQCEKICDKTCAKLIKKYINSKEELLALADIIVMLKFINNKLQAVRPNVLLRNTEKYTIPENVAWVESFVDTLFCVINKNEVYKIIKVKPCKLKNDNEAISNRTYLIRVCYNTKTGTVVKNIPITLQWTQLTNNFSKSYNAILNKTSFEISEEIIDFEAQSVLPFITK